MLDLKLQSYTSWYVKPVMCIKNGYGYRVILKYIDGTEKTQQKSGFSSRNKAEKAREKTIAELYSGTYIVYANVRVKDYMNLWLEEDLRKRTDSYDTYSTMSGIIKNHIVPALGSKKMEEVSSADIQKLYNEKMKYSVSITKLMKTILNVSFRYALNHKIISSNPVKDVKLPKKKTACPNGGNKAFHSRNINPQKTLTLEQIKIILEKSKETPIHMQVLFNVLMGLRRGEINAVKYSNVDYINRTLTIKRQLGRPLNARKEDFAPKTLTKQEIPLKTESSERVIPIPDYVFEAILEERKTYEKNKKRRSKTFQDLDYICCSTYGRPRSKSFHWKYYKKLLRENGLPDIRWHDLRSTFCTLLLKNNFSPKAVSKLMGHAKEIITMDVYGDNWNIIQDCIPEISEFMEMVLPDKEEKEVSSDILIDTEKYLGAG